MYQCYLDMWFETIIMKNRTWQLAFFLSGSVWIAGYNVVFRSAETV